MGAVGVAALLLLLVLPISRRWPDTTTAAARR